MTETEAAAPTCYRHTDRETYVRCTRCDRPICPDCMTEAAVGFQCPNCVREGHKSVRDARTVFGGRAGADAQVTKVIIGLCVIAFVAQLANGQVTDDFAARSYFIALQNEYYRMITSAFLHVTSFPLHIAFNMYCLFMYGGEIERLVGRAHFVVLYLASAFGGSVLSYWLTEPAGKAVGASGAVFGLFGAYFVLARKLRADTSQILFLIGLNLALGFAFRFIDNWAHIGGLLTGAAVAFVYTKVPRGSAQSAIQFAGVAVIVLALAVATLVRTDRIRQDPFRAARSAVSAATTSPTGAPSR